METLYIIGQVVLGLFFIMSGTMHFMKMDMMVKFVESKKLPAPKLGVVLGGIALLLGGLSVLTGWYLNYGLWILVLFVLLASVTMHNFWAIHEQNDKETNMHFFLGNIALVAALLMLMSMMDSWPWVLNA